LAAPPVLDRLNTRLLERREVVRSFVKQARVLEADASGLLLETTALFQSHLTRWPAHAAEKSPARELRQGEQRSGRLRIEALSDTILRVRYAEGAAVPANETPMVVGRFKGPAGAEARVEPDRALYQTAGVRVEVGLDPLAISVADPEGRELCAIGGCEKNAFGQWDSYNTGICRSARDASPIATECFVLRPHEAIYGMGEQFLRLDKVGQTIDLNMLEALGIGTPRSYKNVPFFMSTRGYGVYLNHSSRITAWVGSRHAADLQIAVEDDFLDYTLIFGDLKQILSQYTDITGKGQLPPLWSFGYWQSKISYQSADETLEVARKLREAEVPVDVIHLDTHWFEKDWGCDLEFSKQRFPDPEAFLKELKKIGIKVSLWQLPYIPEGSQLFEDLKAVDGFVKNRDGGIYDVGICMVPGFEGLVGCIDYTNPEARRVHGDYLRRLFGLGARVIKVDFGEQAPLDGVYHDGTPGHRVHNLYPLLYNRTIAEVTEQATGERIIWARSAWAGSQRYPLHWGGDSSANWHNLIPQIEAGLGFGLSGFQFWSQDIGGFVGNTGGPLLVRWMQAGMFLSHCRIHGFGARELYAFEPEVLRICRDYIRLRYRLLPYIYGSAIDCVERSLPLARALVVEYQDDPNVWRLGDEWLLGDALLVAPIADPSDAREVYLPAGRWTDWWTGERHEGGRWMHVEAGLETLPLFVCEGAIVPMGPVMNHVGEFPIEAITLRIAPFATEGETRFVVPVNDERVEVRYVAAAGAQRVELGPSRVNFDIEVLGEPAGPIELVHRR
jgi:alpha-D-xyloside xylohydrolase